ncbi:PLP-dependent transferase [Apiospora kogelbergensis]|uniref:PLP-dependent transferase n=1 Tax=Apiospora kogelbergensis TaxID=1337665 RepID=A0AAW0Q9Z0_9PEZI
MPVQSLVDFSSNDYLSLAENADIQTNVLARLERRVSVAKRHQTVTQAQEHRRILGSGGSRLLDGNSPLAEGLEKKVAAFHGAPAALLFNSAYDANVGLLSCAPQPGDVVLFDEAIHASVHDGMRLSRASQCIPFSHSSIARGVENGAAADSAAPSIDDVLKEITAAGYPNMGVRDGSSNVFICVEAVYSMDGSVLRARDLVKTVKNHLPHGSGHIIIDEAHSTGVLGSRGRGLVCDSGLEKAIWARVHGFGKAMGCAGGKDHFIKPKPRAYLVNYARTFIYTTSMTFPSLVCIDAAYDYLAGGHAEDAQGRLLKLVHFAHQLLRDICGNHGAPSSHHGLIRVGTDAPGSPILPIFTTRPRSLASFCQLRGYMVRPIVAPTVPVGAERVRLCLHARNTLEQVEGLGAVVKEWIQLQGQGGCGRSTTGRPRL